MLLMKQNLLATVKTKQVQKKLTAKQLTAKKSTLVKATTLAKAKAVMEKILAKEKALVAPKANKIKLRQQRQKFVSVVLFYEAQKNTDAG